MTDNEKRAHDLALFALPIQAARDSRKEFDTEKYMKNYDIYETYKSLYNKYLQNLNDDFPNN